MEYYWPMGVTTQGDIMSTYGSSASEEEYMNCFKTWEEGYHKTFLVKWVDVQEGSEYGVRKIMIKDFTPKKIYFDMDGVIVDFEGGVKKYLNINPRPQGYHPDYDNKLFEAMRKETHFYAKLDPIKGSIDIVKKAIEKHGIENVEILTGVPKPSRNIPEAAADKAKWIAERISPDIKVNAVLRKEKINFVENRRSVLIDDFESNVKEWRKAGGTAIHFNGNLYDRNNKAIEYLGVI